MGLLTFLKRSSSASAAGPASIPPVFGDESVERARSRARHRLIGAVVLVGLAVIGFPLLFETQPRPIPVDLPIEIPKKEAVPPLALPRPAAVPETEPAATEPVAETAEEASKGRDVPEPASPPAPKPEPRQEPKPALKTEVRAETKPAQKPEPKAETRQEPRASARSSADHEAERAQALLAGRQPPSPAESGRAAAANRFALQIGAFSESGGAREARQKVERLGLRTYTQEVETGEGRRIRVRVGPFASREEADQATSRLRAAGMPAALLSL